MLKYTSRIEEAIESITKIDNDMAVFLKEKVFKEQSLVYNQYRIRLFLFSIWWRKWINI
jgi:hypothetical protein